MTVPSAGIEEAVDVGAPPPSDSDVDLSDDQIIDRYSGPDSGSEEAPAEDAVEETVEAKPVVAEKELAEQPKPEEPTAVETEPEDFKQLLRSLAKSKPELAQKIRDEHYRLAAYEELMTVPELRELQSVFQSSQDAKEARDAAADLMALDEVMASEEPEQIIGIISERNPQAFQRIVSNIGRALSEADPALYTEHVSKPAVDHFRGYFRDLAAQTRDEELEAALDIIEEREQRLTGRAGVQAGRQDRTPWLNRLEELERRDREMTIRGFENFGADVKRAFSADLSGEIQKTLDRTGAALGDGAKKEIVERVGADIRRLIGADPLLQRKLRYAFNAGARDDRHQQEIVGMLMARAKGFIGARTRDAVKWMTDEILRVNRDAITKQTKASAQRDAGSGGARAPKAKTPPKDTSGMTEDQIIDAYTDV